MEEKYFRKAEISDFKCVWDIILFAKESMKQKGSQQWQDGYPFKEEPTYKEIKGAWLNNEPYTVIHRMAVGEKGRGKGIASYIMEQAEEISMENSIFSIRVDTNFDNYVMKHILEKKNYAYCGIIQVRDGEREAFQKNLR